MRLDMEENLTAKKKKRTGSGNREAGCYGKTVCCSAGNPVSDVHPDSNDNGHRDELYEIRCD